MIRKIKYRKDEHYLAAKWPELNVLIAKNLIVGKVLKQSISCDLVSLPTELPLFKSPVTVMTCVFLF